MKIIASTKEMSRGDWLNLRTQFIGGSDASIVLGLNKWKTPFELWLEKTGEVIPEEIDNDAIYFGNALENFVAKEFERRSGKKVRRKNQMMKHDEHEFMMANIDREVVGEKAGLECKTTSAYNLKEWEAEEIPTAYLIQCQHYMAVTGYKTWYIAVLIGGQKFVFKEIERDEELINMIIAAEKEFWEYHVKGENPPALDGSSAAEKYLKERYTESDPGRIVDISKTDNDSIVEMLRIKETIKEMEKEAKAIENRIKNQMEEAELAISKDFTIKWKTVVTNRVDSKRLKAEYPEIYEIVLNASSSRRFEVKEIKVEG